jgi:uncharacterized protein (DUF362 family)
MLARRRFLTGSMAVALAPLAASCRSAAWEKTAYRQRPQSHVAILPAPHYGAALTEVLLQGIKLCRLHVHEKTVVLKPNLVEYDPAGAINTHPAVIAAAIEAFRSLGARQVLVAEGPGHRRDTEYLLTASGLYTLLKEQQTRFIDLNYDEVQPLQLGSHFTDLQHLYLPHTVLKADLLVSMPKLKTHHWVGVTLALKNLFGVIPGAHYGWPKNVLHWAGIHESILDISSTLSMPQFAIVDGIVGMEGNGPIQGISKPCGVLICGDDPVAVDATAARLMQIDPTKVPYLAQAGQFLGNIRRDKIQQIGERLERFQQDFRLIPSLQHLKGLDA